jgi:BirA family transcriptional regulator, biotin operon repressor / biotin---[acetyl-CoA-carboxylase] ligase
MALQKRLTYKLIKLDTVDSTNNYALNLAKKGAKQGTVVIASFQIQGRGRHQRTWISPPGTNVLLSLIVRPHVKVHKVPTLTYITGMAVKKTLESISHVECTLKDPNDVLINKRKIAGILTESRSSKEGINYVVIGVGINVNSQRKDLLETATSLYEETERSYPLEQVIKEFLRFFKDEYVEWCRRVEGE